MKRVITFATIAALAVVLVPPAAAQLYVKDGGKVGIGDFETTLPIQPLHLKQPGNPNFTFESTTQSVRWNFKIGGTGAFTISKVGTAGAELLLQNVNQSNTMLVGGGITAASFNVGSSRELKEGFEPVSPGEVLDGVARLPISHWRLKADPDATQRIGPMAEDFHATFGGASDKTISMSDATGVALAAIQGLHQESQAKDRLIAELLQRIERLEQKLADR